MERRERDRTGTRLAALGLAAALSAAACAGDGRAGEEARATAKPALETAAPPDVLLITIDTVRADRVGPRPDGSTLTPRIDALAAAGVRFSNAIAPVPLTLPSHATLLTGRQPPGHTVRDNGAYRLPDGETTLAEVLQAGGYRTAAFVGAEVLGARHGLDQGFEHYDDDVASAGASPFLFYPERPANAVVAAASAWLDRAGAAPVFVWVHLFDPHAPYAPPEPEASTIGSPYDGEIAFADRMVGRLLDHWESRRGTGPGFVVVTSDHGESLGEHGEATHGVLVHDATLRVPLVIRAPGRARDTPVTDPVHLADVAPTVLALLGRGVPPGVHGRDLSPYLDGGTVPWSAAAGYAESLYAQRHHGAAGLYALRGARWKLIRGAGDELYDLAADPGELRDVAAREPELTRDLAADLSRVAAATRGGPAERIELDEDARAALESLGYVVSTPTGGGDPGRHPREALASLAAMADADRAAAAGDLAAAVAGYRRVIGLEPGSVDARVRLASLLSAAGRGGEAVELLGEAVAIAPHDVVLHQQFAHGLERAGRWREALAAYEAGLVAHPADRELRNGRWRCLNQFGRRDDLLRESERAVAADPTDGAARYVRAVACCGADLDDYIAALERELAGAPGDPLLTRALAQARAERAR